MVYLAHDPESRTDVAIKVLLPQVSEDENLISRFEREIEVLSKFHHPNIIQILAMGQEDQTRYYVMEYVHGQDIGVMLKESGKLSWPVVLDYGMQICRGLKNAHDHGVVHRDLKPVNFLVNDQNTVKIADFGIARPWGDHGQTQTGSLLGTLAFMSPEQAEGNQATFASDIYSLGASLYVMLTGCPPFDSPSIPGILKLIVNEPLEPPRMRAPDIPAELDELICAMMAKRPEDRPRSAYNVECKLRDVTEVGQGRMFRKSGRSPNLIDELPDPTKKPSESSGPPQVGPTVQQNQTVPQSNRQAQPREKSESGDKTELDSKTNRPPAPSNETIAHDSSEEYRLQPLYEANADDMTELAGDDKPLTKKERLMKSYRVPVQHTQPVEWTQRRKLFDTQTIVLLSALVVVLLMAVWAKPILNAILPVFEQVPEAIADDVPSPEPVVPVTVEYGNSFNQVTKFFMTNQSSQAIASVRMLVTYMDESSILESAVVTTTLLGDEEGDPATLLNPYESRVVVEPVTEGIVLSEGTGRIEEPEGTADVIVSIQQVTFLDQSIWSPADHPDPE